MRVWRLVRGRRLPQAFTGEGARLVGGRWNSPGLRVVYASENLALATLEYLVHTDPLRSPKNVFAVWAEIPHGIAADTISVRRLPKNWRRFEPPITKLVKLGDDWIKRGHAAVLIVPSAVLPLQNNYLLNPLHPQFRSIRTGSVTPITFDQRLFD